MKIRYGLHGEVTAITDREMLVLSSSGVNIIRAYSADPAVNAATVKFKRNDSFVIGPVAMIPVKVDDDGITAINAYEISLVDSLGVLAVKDELQITVQFITATTDASGNETSRKVQTCGLVTAHVYGAVETPNDMLYLQVEMDTLTALVNLIPANVDAAVKEKTAGMDASIAANAAAVVKEASDRQTADTAEAEARAAADAKEVTDRNAAITEAVNTEKSARESADALEVTNRTNAISTHNQDANAHGDIRQLIANLQSIVTTIDAEADADTVINKLHEVVALLNGYAEGTTLIDLLGGKIDKTSITNDYNGTDATKVFNQAGANALYVYLMNAIKYLNAFTDNIGELLTVNWDNTTPPATVQAAIREYVATKGILEANIKVGMSVLIRNTGSGYTFNNGFYSVNTNGCWLWIYCQDVTTTAFRFEPTIPIPQADTTNLATKQELTDHNGNAEAHPAIRQLIADMQTAINSINGIIAVADGQDDADSVINKLHEIVNLLSGYAEGTTLTNLLIAKADKTEIPIVPTKLSAFENDSGYTKLAIGTLATQAGRGDLTQTAYQFSQNHTNPDISTDIAADAASDAKTASPKAVKTYIDSLIIAGLGGSY